MLVELRAFETGCLEDPMDRGTWWAAVHGVAKSWTRLRDFTFTFHFPALEKEMATHSSIMGIPGGSDGNESACNVGDRGSIPGLGRYFN